MESFADKVIKGNIFTGRDENEWAQAACIRDGKYIYVGSSEGAAAYVGDGTVIEELPGCVLPGFTEGHAHVSLIIERINGVRFGHTDDKENYLTDIRNYLDENPDTDFLTGHGFECGLFENNMPTKEILDELIPDIPAMFLSEDCHAFWANSKALSLAGHEDSEGLLQEADTFGLKHVLPEYSVEDYKRAILEYQRMALSHGILYAYEPILSNREDTEKIIEAYHELDKEGKLLIRFNLAYTIQPYDDYAEIIEKVVKYKKMYSSRQLKIAGVKYFIDGVLEGHTAFLREPYGDSPDNYGECLWDTERFNAACELADKNNLQIHMHVIGDAALDVALDGIEHAYEKNGRRDNRHCITHLQVVEEDQLERLEALDVLAVTDPYWFVLNPNYYYEIEKPYLGEKKAGAQYPLRALFERNIPVSVASDYPVTNYPSVVLAIATGVNRKTKEYPEGVQNEAERATIGQMLYAVTRGGAYQLFNENSVGSIAVGYSADYVVLDRCITDVSWDEIEDLSVTQVCIKGVVKDIEEQVCI